MAKKQKQAKQSKKNKPKKRINSARKGADFERKVARVLSKITEVEWKRVPLSGAAATTGAKPSYFIGDVYCNEPLYKYKPVIEVKITKTKAALSDFYNLKSKVWQWFQQADKESKPKSKGFLLIFKDGSHRVYAAFFFRTWWEVSTRFRQAKGLIWDLTAKVDPDVDLIFAPKEENLPYYVYLWDLTEAFNKEDFVPPPRSMMAAFEQKQQADRSLSRDEDEVE